MRLREDQVLNLANRQLGTIVRHIQKLVGPESVQGLTDGQLLKCFAASREEAAFTALMQRHGPLVLGVCRQVLHHEQDAEDAFQATFLVLARNAASIRKADSLASWLYGVAYRTSLKAKHYEARRRVHEHAGRMPVQSPVTEAASRELQELLHEELHRLPKKLRAPFVLCCMEGQRRRDAARQLGWKLGTLSSRLAHTRERLKERLAGRGVTLGAVLGLTALSGGAVSRYGAAPPLHGRSLTVSFNSLLMSRHSWLFSTRFMASGSCLPKGTPRHFSAGSLA
jgi:RNA polymerase sigma factor (sigma-70 family)